MAELPTTSPGNRLNFERVLPLFILTFVDVLGLTIILPLLHLYSVAFGGGALEIGLTAAAFPLAQLIGVPVMGALSDRYGRKPLLLISQVTTCISFLILAAANSFQMVLISRVVDGLFGANLATAQAAITDLTDEKTRAQGLGLTGAAFGLGFLIGPAIAFGALEFSDNLALPALIAAAYSFGSILLTLFLFRETLPAEQRGAEARLRAWTGFDLLRQPNVRLLTVLMFAQQVVFFGFESLLGLFVLNRVGLLGQGNALVFIFVGLVLVLAQTRLIRPLSRRGGRWLVLVALALLGGGLALLAATPQQPHPFYVTRIVQNEITRLAPNATEALVGDIAVPLPLEADRGLGGMLWLLAALVPVALGAGLIRPGINSLLTLQVPRAQVGAALGVSAAAVSLANAAAPLLGGLLFQRFGPTAPFALGGLVMLALWGFSALALRRLAEAA